MVVLFEYGFVDEEQIMKKLDPIFDNIKSLRTIASIEVLAANALSIDKTSLQKLDIDTPTLEEMVAHLDSTLLVAHQLNQLKLLLKDAEIAALSEKLEEKNYPKSDLPKLDLNDPAPEHVTLGHINSLMNDIKMAVSTATTDIDQNNAKSAQKTILNNINENVLLENPLSDETKQFIELTLNQIVRKHLNTIVNDIMQGKKEKKSKVLDLSEVSIPKKNQPNKN